MEARFRRLIELGDRLFSARGSLLDLWQEIAENFYPERADFTAIRNLGDEFADHLDTSAPIIARRDLGNAFGAMLRPPGKDWFHIRLKRHEVEDTAARQWLEMAERVQRKVMYDRNSGFIRATKEGDHDFAAFGQAVLSSEFAVHPNFGAILLHRTWHLRDVAWSEDSFGTVDHVQRKWKPTAREIVRLFPKTAHPTVRRAAEPQQEPDRTFDIRHVMVAGYNHEKKLRQPWVSLFIDVENEHAMEEVGSWTPYYIIPRWQTVSGSQYAYSPATVAALADARLIQAMTYTLREAGEVAINPPMVGRGSAIKVIEGYAGGFTEIDADYDERLGEAIRPLNKGGERMIPIGLEMTQDVRAMIAEAFFLNRITLPSAGLGGMSPLEVSQRIEEYIRTALPLFEPMETDYNGALCEQDFELILRNGGFGPPSAMPESLGGQELECMFESPLREATDRIMGQRLLEAKSLLVEASPLDPMAAQMVDARVALRDALHGIGVPARWMRDENTMARIEQAAVQKQQAAQMLQTVSAGAQVAEQIGMAGQALAPREQAVAQ